MKKAEKVVKGLVEAVAEMFWATRYGDVDEMRRVCGMAHTNMADALAYIKQLESRIPRWIPVEEQLPPDGIADYLVTIKQKYPHETEWEYYTDKATYGGSYIDGLWDTEYDWIEGQETHITHWMPLPEPPEEAKTNG